MKARIHLNKNYYIESTGRTWNLRCVNGPRYRDDQTLASYPRIWDLADGLVRRGLVTEDEAQDGVEAQLEAEELEMRLPLMGEGQAVALGTFRIQPGPGLHYSLYRHPYVAGVAPEQPRRLRRIGLTQSLVSALMLTAEYRLGSSGREIDYEVLGYCLLDEARQIWRWARVITLGAEGRVSSGKVIA